MNRVKRRPAWKRTNASSMGTHGRPRTDNHRNTTHLHVRGPYIDHDYVGTTAGRGMNQSRQDETSEDDSMMWYEVGERWNHNHRPPQQLQERRQDDDDGDQQEGTTKQRERYLVERSGVAHIKTTHATQTRETQTFAEGRESIEDAWDSRVVGKPTTMTKTVIDQGTSPDVNTDEKSNALSENASIALAAAGAATVVRHGGALLNAWDTHKDNIMAFVTQVLHDGRPPAIDSTNHVEKKKPMDERAKKSDETDMDTMDGSTIHDMIQDGEMDTGINNGKNGGVEDDVREETQPVKREDGDQRKDSGRDEQRKERKTASVEKRKKTQRVPWVHEYDMSPTRRSRHEPRLIEGTEKEKDDDDDDNGGGDGSVSATVAVDTTYVIKEMTDETVVLANDRTEDQNVALEKGNDGSARNEGATSSVVHAADEDQPASMANDSLTIEEAEQEMEKKQEISKREETEHDITENDISTRSMVERDDTRKDGHLNIVDYRVDTDTIPRETKKTAVETKSELLHTSNSTKTSTSNNTNIPSTTTTLAFTGALGDEKAAKRIALFQKRSEARRRAAQRRAQKKIRMIEERVVTSAIKVIARTGIRQMEQQQKQQLRRGGQRRPPAHVLSRLAKGEAPSSISKAEMLRRTRRSYARLPEQRRRQEAEADRRRKREHARRAKEMSKAIRERERRQSLMRANRLARQQQQHQQRQQQQQQHHLQYQRDRKADTIKRAPGAEKGGVLLTVPRNSGVKGTHTTRRRRGRGLV